MSSYRGSSQVSVNADGIQDAVSLQYAAVTTAADGILKVSLTVREVAGLGILQELIIAFEVFEMFAGVPAAQSETNHTCKNTGQSSPLQRKLVESHNGDRNPMIRHQQ